jgi:hypothetical protein
LSLQAFLVAKVPLSWIAGEVNVSTSAARATGIAEMDTTANTPDAASTAILRLMIVSPFGSSEISRRTLLRRHRCGKGRAHRLLDPRHRLLSVSESQLRLRACCQFVEKAAE